MSLSRRRSARRTSGKTVSLNMRRLLLMRLLLFVEPLWCRTVYESECWTKQEVHDVEDDVVECKTEVEEKC